jgi:hypothetical protein
VAILRWKLSGSQLEASLGIPPTSILSGRFPHPLRTLPFRKPFVSPYTPTAGSEHLHSLHSSLSRVYSGRPHSVPSHHYHHSKLTWTEPVRYWRKASLKAFLEHTLPWQIMAMSLSLPSHHRARGRWSIEEKAQSQQYLYPWEEKALVKFLVQQDALGRSVRIKYVRSIAFSAARQRPPDGQTKQASREELGSALPQTPSRTQSEKKRGAGLEPLRHL